MAETTIPADLFGDALLSGWVGPVEWRLSPNTDAWETAIASGDARSINGRFRIRLHDGSVAPTTDRIRLDLTRVEARHRLCVVLAAGAPCTAHDCRRPACEGGPCPVPAHRTPAPAWHLLPTAEGGTLPATYAHHAPVLLACHARRAAAGRILRGIRGPWEWTELDYGSWARPVVAEVGREARGVACIIPWAGRPRMLDASAEHRSSMDTQSLLAGYALIDPDGALRLPELPHA